MYHNSLNVDQLIQIGVDLAEGSITLSTAACTLANWPPVPETLALFTKKYAVEAMGVRPEQHTTDELALFGAKLSRTDEEVLGKMAELAK